MKPHLEFTPEDCFDYLVADQVDVARVREVAERGQQLTVKLGIDPTSVNLHVGRAVPLWRLRAFQELGHKIVLIVGDFTALVGDTSDKESERPMLSPAEVRANMASYEEQLWRVLNPDKKELVEIRYNSEWLAGLDFAQVCELADAFSVNQFVKREIIAKRLGEGGRVSLREMLYPLMQGYDSVAVGADVELGGTDQWFNLLAGRTLQERNGQTPQAVIVSPIIVGTDGVKMSSSRGNIISLNQDAFGLFTQMMQVPDENLVPYLDFFPRPGRPFTKEELQAKLDAGENPRDLKVVCAHRMAELLFGTEEADAARAKWDAESGADAAPDFAAAPEFVLEFEEESLANVIRMAGLATSNSEARAKIEQGGVKLIALPSEQIIPVTDAQARFSRADLSGRVLQVGKHRFVRLK